MLARKSTGRKHGTSTGLASGESHGTSRKRLESTGRRARDEHGTPSLAGARDVSPTLRGGDFVPCSGWSNLQDCKS